MLSHILHKEVYKIGIQEEAFTEYVRPYMDGKPRIYFSKEEKAVATDFANKKAAAKLSSGEKCHVVDGGQEVKRNYTGVLGEMAVSKYINVDFLDFSIGHSSAKYNIPDIGEFDVGVKTVEYGKMPIVQKKSYYPEIICIKMPDDSVLIMGIAKKSTLNNPKNLSEDLILSPALRARNVKRAFTGFKELEPLKPGKAG